MDALAKQIARRKAVRNSMKAAMSDIQNELQNPVINVEQLKDNLAKIGAREKKLSALNQAIFDLMQDPDEFEGETMEVEDFLDEITLWKDRAKRYVDKMEQGQQGGSSTPSLASQEQNFPRSRRNVKLPQLEIKKYNGDFNDWQRFWGQYQGAIGGDQELSETDKLIYLKSLLVGPALSAIANVKEGVGSYEIASKNLEKRFGRRPILISTRMNNILKLTPVLKSSDIEGLRHLHDTCQIEVASLEALEMFNEGDGELMAHILGGLLPVDLLERFGNEPEGLQDCWKIKDLLNFLRKLIEGKERALAIQRPGNQSKISSNTHNDKTHSKPVYSGGKNSSVASASSLSVSASSEKRSGAGQCLFCEGAHPYYNCNEIPVSEKRGIVISKKVCFLCLRSGHQATECRGKIQQCRKCKRKHHQILCNENKGEGRENNYTRPNQNQENAGAINVNSAVQEGQGKAKKILLQTVQAVALGANGKEVKVRCLFDGGSHRCFINNKLSKELGLEKIAEENLNVFKFESNEPTRMVRNKVKVILKHLQSEELVEIEALETPGISGGVFSVPSESIAREMEQWGYPLSDRESEEKGGDEVPLDILIGADYFWTVTKGPVERLSDSLVVINTKLGWTLHGTTSEKGAALTVGVNAVNVMRVSVSARQPNEDDLLSDQVQSFWDLEHIGIKNPPEATKLSEENTLMKDFQKSIQCKNGRYEVAIPWNEKVKHLGDNYEVAKRCTLNLLEKLRKNEEHLKAYDVIIQEQIASGIVERIPENHVIEGPLYYMPHRGVIREESLTTKLRIVNDGSSHAKNVPSLNECMDSGPNLIPELFQVLLRFRENPIAVTGDIEKAYHQIGIIEKDRDAFRFLWIKGLGSPDNETIIELRFTRAPFGGKASMFLLAGTVKTHAQKFSKEYPRASSAILRDLYVDDFVSGGNDVEEVDKLIIDTRNLMAEASMNMRKWHSNSKEIRARYGSEAAVVSDNHKLPNPTNVKVLGLTWDELRDLLTFDVESLLEFMLGKQCTKRWVLRAVARIFDPLGIISPYTIRAKMLLQELWEAKVNWDSELEPRFSEKFNQWFDELRNLIEIVVPRFYLGGCAGESPISIELHGFVDASVTAYASVLYLKSVFASGFVNSVLVASKAKVAPLKNELKKPVLKIPRLELMAAVIGARLVNSVVEALNIKINKVQMWTDSTITLYWIRGDANRWKPFVQNRVREIQERTDPMSWNHVAGKENPADLATRGKSLKDIAKSDLWLHGPPWLKQVNPSVEEFEQGELIPNEIACELRANSQPITVSVNTVQEAREPLFELNKHNQLQKISRITAWVQRFANNARAKDNKTKGSLTTAEIAAAEEYWIKSVQLENYPEEFLSLKNGSGVFKASTLLSLDQN